MTQMARPDYLVIQKVVHWLMAILICLDLFVAQKFGRVMEDWDRLESRSDHASLGTIVTILFVLRIFLRIRYGAAALPSGMPPWQVQAAKFGHFALYFFTAFLIVSGITTAMNASSPIVLFAQIDISLGSTGEELFQRFRPFHEFATNALIVLIVVHVLAALYHHFIAKDDSSSKMLRFWKSEK